MSSNFFVEIDLISTSLINTSPDIKQYSQLLIVRLP